MLRACLCLALVLYVCGHVEAESWNPRPAYTNDPVANPRAIVQIGNARFTILTPYLVRLEHNLNGKFVDGASLNFINRNLSVPEFTTKTSGSTTLIGSRGFQLSFDKEASKGAFTQVSLNVTFEMNNKQVVWRPGMENKGNLGGTVYALDGYPNRTHPMTAGLVSTEGWVLVDDSETPLFDDINSKFPWLATPDRRENATDWYLFVYGTNIRQQLFDYTLVAGPISIPPASAFGSWFSHYYAYSEQQVIEEVIIGYKNHSLPLNHLVLDKDWHVEEPENKQCQTWGGYTWNTKLFPDPEKFVKYLHDSENNLKLILNLHPQTGVDVCQSEYKVLAKALDFDTSKNATIPCDFTSKTLTSELFPIVMDPVGSDYWWTDYDGCGNISKPYVLLWSNHVFDTQMKANNKRPLVLSRNGGPGNHRYPIGFSGDVRAFWVSLNYEVYMTPVAANILFGYWSHDVGGFLYQPSDELYLRWLQFASVAPIFRIHSDHLERRIWTFPSYEDMKTTLLFRNSLGPYIYSQARKTYDTGVSIVHPLYYDFPTDEQAYSYKYQYMFGDDIFAAPVTSQGNSSTKTTSKEIWLPPGEWVDYNTLKIEKGNQKLLLEVPFSQIPLYMRAGSIIPMKNMLSVTNYHPTPLIFTIFPGAASGETLYYEDEVDDISYLANNYTFTFVSYRTENGTTKVTIKEPKGAFKNQPTHRTYQVEIVALKTLKSATFQTPSGSQPIEKVVVDSTSIGWWVGPLGLVLQSPANVDIKQDITFVIQI